MKRYSLEFYLLENYSDRNISEYFRQTFLEDIEPEISVYENYLEKNDIILDLKCHCGKNLIVLQKKGYKNLIGLDFDIKGAKYAQLAAKQILGKNNKIQFSNIDFFSMNYHNLDVVMFLDNELMYLPTLKHRREILKKIHTSLKPNGILILKLICNIEKNNQRKIIKILNPNDFHSFMFVASKKYLMCMFKESNFILINEIKYYSIDSTPLCYIYYILKKEDKKDEAKIV